LFNEATLTMQTTAVCKQCYLLRHLANHDFSGDIKDQIWGNYAQS